MHTPEDYVAWANELTDLMGADWLAEHTPKPHRDPHIIASWILQFRNTPPESLFMSQQLLQIGELMSNIQTLRNAGTQNLEARISDLRSDDPERVASVVHELRVAGGYAYEGRRVFFIPEAGIQTPDLLIDDGIEIECKRKSSASQQDKARFELYGLMQRKLRAVFPENIRHSALLLEIMFHVEPRRELVGRVVEAARFGLRRPDPSQFSEVADGLFTAHIEVLPTGSGPTELFLPRGVTNFDLRSTEAIALDGNGTLGRFINVNVGCDLRQDRVKGTLRSIRSAARQFSGRYPAIVSLDISALADKGDDEALEQLRAEIPDVLRRHTTISRVELSLTQFMGEPGEQIYYTSIEELNNPDARLPLEGTTEQST